MKCPRNKFTNLDYSKPLEDQKKDLCKVCSEYKGSQATWGQHCKASLICLLTGKTLGPEAFDQIPKEHRSHVTHTLSDEGRKEMIKRIESVKKSRRTPLW